MKNLKYQIHAETAVNQFFVWLIIGKLFGGWVWILSGLMMFGNFITAVEATRKLPKDYFK